MEHGERANQLYFDILVETHLGFWLDAFHTCIRKQVRLAPKFFLFDIGVSRALGRTLTIPVVEATSAYGERFEQLIILECFRLNDYLSLDFKFSYLMTKSGLEIDLIVDRPGQPLLLIEIKSTECVRVDHLKSIHSVLRDLPQASAWCLSRDPVAKRVGSVDVIPWQSGLRKLFGLPDPG